MTREEIREQLDGNNNGHLGDLLTDLVYCDFLRKYKVREKKVKTNSSIYKLVDFYTLFCHSFIGKASMNTSYFKGNVCRLHPCHSGSGRPLY